VGVVGPSGAGKSTLIAGLTKAGYRCTHIAQEHSYVPQMWRRIAKPTYLIYLAASFPVCTRRRNMKWLQSDYDEELRRLAHARANASLQIDTDDKPPTEVLRRALAFLQSQS
jgi:ABC-type cobalamin/Fe3+-siderophores transport system ATPase subunit